METGQRRACAGYGKNAPGGAPPMATGGRGWAGQSTRPGHLGLRCTDATRMLVSAYQWSRLSVHPHPCCTTGCQQIGRHLPPPPPVAHTLLAMVAVRTLRPLLSFHGTDWAAPVPPTLLSLRSMPVGIMLFHRRSDSLALKGGTGGRLSWRRPPHTCKRADRSWQVCA